MHDFTIASDLSTQLYAWSLICRSTEGGIQEAITAERITVIFDQSLDHSS